MHRIALRNSARALAATPKVHSYHTSLQFFHVSSSQLVIQCAGAAAPIAARSYATAKPGAF
jgi:hypothetical protein